MRGAVPRPSYISSVDPTTLDNSQRARGITSLAMGTGPSAGLLYALCTDSRVHTYSLPSLEPLSGHTPPFSSSSSSKDSATGDSNDPWCHQHPHKQLTSFYVKLSISPCGRWLASGGATNGRAFLFDIGTSGSTARARLGGYSSLCRSAAVELWGQTGEIGAVDWADGMFAACSDDGTVRVWRPDREVFQRCQENPEEAQWDWSWSAS